MFFTVYDRLGEWAGGVLQGGRSVHRALYMPHVRGYRSQLQ